MISVIVFVFESSMIGLVVVVCVGNNVDDVSELAGVDVLTPSLLREVVTASFGVGFGVGRGVGRLR